MTTLAIPKIVRNLPKGGMIWCEYCDGFWFKDHNGQIGHLRQSGRKCQYDNLDHLEGNT